MRILGCLIIIISAIFLPIGCNAAMGGGYLFLLFLPLAGIALGAILVKLGNEILIRKKLRKLNSPDS